MDTSEYRDFQMCVHRVAVRLDVARVVRGLAVVWADLTDVAPVDVEVVEAYLLVASFDKRLDYTDLDMNTSFRIQNNPGLKLRWAYGGLMLNRFLMIWRIDHWVALCAWSH